MENIKRLEIQYSDYSIHDADCYKFAKAILDSGEIVYYIEYKDYKNRANNEFVDSYAIIELDNKGWHKTSRHVDYHALSSHTIEEYSVDKLNTTTLNFKQSYDYDFIADRRSSYYEQQEIKDDLLKDYQMEEDPAKKNKETPLFVQPQTETIKQEIDPMRPLESSKNLNQSQIVYVPLIVDKASKQFIHPYSVLVNAGWKFDKTETDNLELPDGVGGLAVEDYYEPETVKETFKNDTYNCQSVKYAKVDHIPPEISYYINQLSSTVKEKGEEYVRFDELESQVINGITYKFVKNPGYINLNDFTSLNVYLKKGEEEKSKLDTLEKFLRFDLPIGYGLVEYAPELGKVYTGMTKDNLIKYLREENQRKDQIISELQNPNLTFDDGAPQR